MKKLTLACPSLLLALLSPAAHADSGALDQALQKKIDTIATETLTGTETPSLTIAIVQGGKLAFNRAYGKADTTMRYQIGSVTKQFVAASVLLLQEEGKLSIGDPVSKYFPNLTRANDITIRQILSHTSGYLDFWPQDFTLPAMLTPILPEQIMQEWGTKPLGFEPSTDWQYSNTNYVIAGLIVEKASGMPLFDFMRSKIFEPLGMKSVLDLNQEAPEANNIKGYQRVAHGPAREAAYAARGWLYAAGQLAMTSEDLAKWDISVIEQSLLKPSSYSELERAQVLKNGTATQYGLGVYSKLLNGHRVVRHDGEVPGFVTQNDTFPDDRVAVIAMANGDREEFTLDVALEIEKLVLPPATDPAALKQVQDAFAQLQSGKIDRSLFSANGNSYYTEQALKDFMDSLKPYGAPKSFTETYHLVRGGLVYRSYDIQFAQKTGSLTVYWTADGKIEEFMFF